MPYHSLLCMDYVTLLSLSSIYTTSTVEQQLQNMLEKVKLPMLHCQKKVEKQIPSLKEKRVYLFLTGVNGLEKNQVYLFIFYFLSCGIFEKTMLMIVLQIIFSHSRKRFPCRCMDTKSSALCPRPYIMTFSSITCNCYIAEKIQKKKKLLFLFINDKY